MSRETIRVGINAIEMHFFQHRQQIMAWAAHILIKWKLNGEITILTLDCISNWTRVFLFCSVYLLFVIHIRFSIPMNA